MSLVGESSSPILHVKAQTGIDFVSDANLRRMASTDANARDFGNYVLFEDVSPDANGNLTLNIAPESPNIGVNVLPTVNALQLVRALPGLRIAPGPAASEVTVSWNRAAIGYTLKASTALGSTAQWNPVSEVLDPLPGAGSQALSKTGGARFFRLERQP